MDILLIAGKLALKILAMIKQLTLYSTSHCHLCELAHTHLLHLPDGFKLEVIDIADDEALLAQYGLRIPVLHRNGACNRTHRSRSGAAFALAKSAAQQGTSDTTHDCARIRTI